MKKHSLDENLENARKRRSAPRNVKRTVKMLSWFLVSSLIAVSSPVLSIGHASDICLQVPVEATLPESSGSGDGSNVRFIELKPEDEDATNDIVKENTFMIIQQTDRDGMLLEMLDESAFTATSDDMYVATDTTSLHVKADNNSQVILSLDKDQAVHRLSMGTVWSYVQYEVRIFEILQRLVELAFYPICVANVFVCHSSVRMPWAKNFLADFQSYPIILQRCVKFAFSSIYIANIVVRHSGVGVL